MKTLAKLAAALVLGTAALATLQRASILKIGFITEPPVRTAVGF